MRHVLFGAAFGFVLVRSGATDPEIIRAMFRFEDAHILGVMGVAIALIALGLAIVKRTPALAASRAAIKAKSMAPGIVPGGLLFGAGWAISGACPGTVLAQVGSGSLAALATLAGVVIGTMIHRWITEQRVAAPIAASGATRG